MLTNLSLFSGAGGLDLAAKWTGKIKTVTYVECDPYAQGVLMSRMRDGQLDDAPIFEDVRTFRGTSLRGNIDIVSGGFPCTDISTANYWATDIKSSQRSGLWREFYRIICEVRPEYVLLENVPGIFIRGFGDVLGDLAKGGYDAEWECVSACSFGAPHTRERMFLVANSNGKRRIGMEKNKKDIRSREYCSLPRPWRNDQNYLRVSVAWHGAKASPGVLRVDDGLAEELDRLRLCGNGVCPQQAPPSWEKIIEMSEAVEDLHPRG